ncbi:MAG: glycosyltransferase family 39 protein, partial [Bdellovibrionia bacterium]
MEPSARKFSSLLFVYLCAGLLLSHLTQFFLRTPTIWPDESLFAAPAIDLIRHGKMGTPLLTEVLPGIGERTYWMPPVYFVLLSGVFKIFGPGILAMRGLTLAVSFGVMALTALIAVEIGLGVWGALFGFCILSLHELFESTLVVGRMESLVLLFLFSSLWLVVRELNHSEHAPMRALRLAWAGLFAGLAAMTHPFGVVGCATLGVALLFHSPKNVSLAERLKLLMIAALAAIACVIPWGFYILQSPEDFKGQFGSQMARKAAMVSSYSLFEILRFNLEAFCSKGWVVGALFLILGLLGIRLCGLKKRGAWAVFWAQSFILVMLLSTREVWYPAYLIPLTAVGLSVLTRLESIQYFPRKIAMSLFVLAWIGSGYWCLRGFLHRVHESVHMFEAHHEPTAYLKWAQKINQALPQNKQVLIASIPDPTFGLLDREDLKLRQFSPVSTESVQYEQYLASADYIVVSQRVVDARVEAYARKNGVLADTIVMPDDPEFKAYIFKM